MKTTYHPFWDGHLPVDTIQIANKVNITVYASESLNLLGLIEKDTQGKYHITYNSQEAVTRIRYLIAYALGYIEMGFMKTKNEHEIKAENFQLHTLDLADKKANGYALDLLMPKRMLEYVVFNKNIDTIEKITQTFDVSQAAASAQLKRQNII